MKNKVPMTPKMLNVLNFIKKYVRKKKYNPTFREMADNLGYKSKNSITVLVNKLVARGEVTKIKGYRRNIEIEPKVIRDLQSKEKKVVELMYKHKRLYREKQDEQHRITEKISDLKSKQEFIYT
jgi:SOS-response transcriptional repressor LexA